MWRSCSSAGLAAWLLLAVAHAADTPASAGAGLSANGRTDITARKITMRNQENKAIFEGNVVLKKGVLVVGGAPKIARKGTEELPTISNRAVSMIEATGKVEIEKADGRATCRKAVYNEEERKIILTGDPIAWQHGTRVSGRKIIMFLDDDRTIVEGESRVMIEPEGGGRRANGAR
jgi:lipopolysaccharide export system protein LptA